MSATCPAARSRSVRLAAPIAAVGAFIGLLFQARHHAVRRSAQLARMLASARCRKAGEVGIGTTMEITGANSSRPGPSRQS